MERSAMKHCLPIMGGHHNEENSQLQPHAQDLCQEKQGMEVGAGEELGKKGAHEGCEMDKDNNGE